jgi:uncharacterized membrane protein
MATKAAKGTAGQAGGGDQLRESVQRLAGALGKRAVSALGDRVSDTAGRLTDYAEGGGGGLVSALTGATKDVAAGRKPGKSMVGGLLSGTARKVGGKVKDLARGVKEAFGGGGGTGKKIKVTNIVEQIDLGVPVRIAYDQWTQFTEFPSFMKKVEQVEQESDEKLSWRAQIFLSHRNWKSTIIEQVPDERIVWRSEGAKGYVDGAVTFHEVTPDLTRVLLVLEYHPQGFFEKTGNIWRAQGRRARLELKHFRRHVMTYTLLHTDELRGWRGEIRDSQVVEEPEEAQTETEGGAEAEADEQEPEEPEEAEEPEESGEAEAERPRQPTARREPRHAAEREPAEEAESAVPAQRGPESRRGRVTAGRHRREREEP